MQDRQQIFIREELIFIRRTSNSIDTFERFQFHGLSTSNDHAWLWAFVEMPEYKDGYRISHL